MPRLKSAATTERTSKGPEDTPPRAHPGDRTPPTRSPATESCRTSPVHGCEWGGGGGIQINGQRQRSGAPKTYGICLAFRPHRHILLISQTTDRPVTKEGAYSTHPDRTFDETKKRVCLSSKHQVCATLLIDATEGLSITFILCWFGREALGHKKSG